MWLVGLRHRALGRSPRAKLRVHAQCPVDLKPRAHVGHGQPHGVQRQRALERRRGNRATQAHLARHLTVEGQPVLGNPRLPPSRRRLVQGYATAQLLWITKRRVAPRLHQGRLCAVQALHRPPNLLVVPRRGHFGRGQVDALPTRPVQAQVQRKRPFRPLGLARKSLGRESERGVKPAQAVGSRRAMNVQPLGTWSQGHLPQWAQQVHLGWPYALGGGRPRQRALQCQGGRRGGHFGPNPRTFVHPHVPSTGVLRRLQGQVALPRIGVGALQVGLPVASGGQLGLK